VISIDLGYAAPRRGRGRQGADSAASLSAVVSRRSPSPARHPYAVGAGTGILCLLLAVMRVLCVARRGRAERERVEGSREKLEPSGISSAEITGVKVPQESRRAPKGALTVPSGGFSAHRYETHHLDTTGHETSYAPA